MEKTSLKSKQQIKTAKDYFDAIAARVSELNTISQTYLDKFEFIPSDEIADRIWVRAWQIFEVYNKDFDCCPKLAADIIDNGVPFCSPSKRGSLFDLLALSIVSKDAHLRNLLERIEGRTTETLPFPIMAENPLP